MRTLREGNGVTFDTCVAQAKALFVSLFNHRIRDLTHHFPADAKDPKTGEMFWTGTKRFPTPTEFDPADPQHAAFVTAVANLLAVNYGVQPPPDGPETLVPNDSPLRDKAALAAKAAAVSAPAWEPPATKAPPTDEEEDDEVAETSAPDGNEEEEVRGAAPRIRTRRPPFRQTLTPCPPPLPQFNALLQEAEAFDPSGVKFEPADFEKDEDRNFHIDFIAAAANLRATNYKIEQASRHTCKMIAGKIIPAVATTTASVTGLIMLELYKLMQGKDMEEFRNSSNNLGTNLYLFSEPMPPQKAKDTYDYVAMEEVKCVPPGFTKWDKVRRRRAATPCPPPSLVSQFTRRGLPNADHRQRRPSPHRGRAGGRDRPRDRLEVHLSVPRGRRDACGADGKRPDALRVRVPGLHQRAPRRLQGPRCAGAHPRAVREAHRRGDPV